MAYILIGILFLSLLFVVKLVKGVIKLVLILILIGVMIALFAGRDEVGTTIPAPAAAPVQTSS